MKFEIENSDYYRSFKHARDEGCIFQYYENETYDGRIVRVRGRDLIYYASCSYMGLEKHPLMINAGIEAIKKYGTQSPSSRGMLSSPLYTELEILLHDMFPGHQVVTQTVTLAHCAVLPLLITEKDAIILDAYVHNSVRMAASLCRANGTFAIVSKHNDVENIKYLYYRLKKEGYRKIWYCADGIYSIHGNKCKINELYQLMNEEDDFYTYIDDAHGTGWCGKHGEGYILSEQKLHEKMILIVSFAKSMAASGGGIITSDSKLAEFITLSGQTMIFSGPIQPATLGALIAGVKLHLSDEYGKIQKQLVDKITYFRKKSIDLGLDFVTNDVTPIQLLRIGSIDLTSAVILKLIDDGFLATSAIYPVIAKGDEGIRVTLTNHLTMEDIDNFLTSLKSNIELINFKMKEKQTA